MVPIGSTMEANELYMSFGQRNENNSKASKCAHWIPTKWFVVTRELVTRDGGQTNASFRANSSNSFAFNNGSLLWIHFGYPESVYWKRVSFWGWLHSVIWWPKCRMRVSSKMPNVWRFPRQSTNLRWRHVWTLLGVLPFINLHFSILSDGKNYPNLCELNHQACRIGRTVSVRYNGSCGKETLINWLPPPAHWSLPPNRSLLWCQMSRLADLPNRR